MFFAGAPRQRSLIVAFGIVTGISCGKAKSALKDALGIDELTQEETTSIKKNAGWDDAKLAKFEILAGFKLTDNFQGDIGGSTEIPFPLSLSAPDAAKGQAQNQALSLALLKKREFTIGDNKFTRFEIVSVGRYDFDKKSIVIDGDKLGDFLDEKDRVKKSNNNQSGEYLIVKSKGDGGLVYLTGDVKVKPNDGSAMAAVGGAMIYTSTSPFVAQSGSSSGKYLLAVVGQDGGGCKQGGMISAVKTTGLPTGTPAGTQSEVPCIGALDQYKSQFDSKTDKLNQKSQADELYGKSNKVVTDFLGLWKMGVANLTFVQAPAPKEPAALPPPPPNPPTPPTETPKIDPPVAKTETFVRSEPVSGQEFGYNLGCTATTVNRLTGADAAIVTDPSKFDDYGSTKGWRISGDVRITTENFEKIFGGAEANRQAGSRNPDVSEGYCLLTTGNQLFNITKVPLFQPKDGKVSEMWQKVKVPDNATGIQIRAAFFSMEYPTFVGSQFNDAFFVKFDESPKFLAQGNLNDLAGINNTDEAVRNAVNSCKDKTSFGADESYPCGDWNNVTFNNGAKDLNGELWNVTQSTEGPALQGKFQCGDENGGLCYPGMIRPRVLCAPLDKDAERGKVLTLRIGVTDVGDPYYDSALAVDSVVFTTAENPCAQLFSNEEQSAATRWSPN
jgi:hypothetical protein